MSRQSIDRICSHAMLCIKSAAELGKWQRSGVGSLLAYADSGPCGEGLHRGKCVIFEYRLRIVKPPLGKIAVRFMKICSRMISCPLMDADGGLEHR